jgi:hypothetical protein
MCMIINQSPPPQKKNNIKRLGFVMGRTLLNYILMAFGISREDNAGLCSLCMKWLVRLLVYFIKLQGCVRYWIWAFTDKVFVFVLFCCLKYFPTLGDSSSNLIMCGQSYALLYLWSFICCREAPTIRPAALQESHTAEQTSACDDWKRLQAL